MVGQATPDMAVTLLEIARIFATKVPGKIDADVLQLLWKVSFLSIYDHINGWLFAFVLYMYIAIFLLLSFVSTTDSSYWGSSAESDFMISVQVLSCFSID